jgi:hypothetical protein
MRYLIGLLFALSSIVVHAQPGSINVGAIRSKVEAADTATAKTNISGYGTIFYNKAQSKFRVCYSGTCYDLAVSTGGGSVTSVSGTLDRITSTGGATPAIDISPTFEALLGKVASPLSQFASTSSTQLRGVIGDELGTGAALFDGATPTSLVLTNATGLPYTGLTGTVPFWALTGGTSTLTGNTTIAQNASTLTYTAASLPSGTITSTTESATFTGTASTGEIFTGKLLNYTYGGTTTSDDLWSLRIQNGGTDAFRFTNVGQIWFGSSSGAGRIGVSTVSGGSSVSGTVMYNRGLPTWGTTNGNMSFLYHVRSVTSVNDVVAFDYTYASGEDNLVQTSGSATYIWKRDRAAFNITGSATPTLVNNYFNPNEVAITSGTKKYAYISSGTNWYHGFNTIAPTSTVDINGSLEVGYVAKSALYTLTDSDYTVEVTSGTHTQTLPTAVGHNRIYCVTNSGSGVVTLATTSSQTFVNISGTPTTRTFNQFNGGCYQSNGANWLKLNEY